MGFDFKAVIRPLEVAAFDKSRVIAMMEKRMNSALHKFAAFIRQRDRSSIRKRKKSSRPGEPPSSHTGLLRKNIFFAMDKSRNVMLVGAVRLNQIGFTGKSFTKSVRGLAPQTLEHGGEVAVLMIRPPGWTKWKRADFRSRSRIAESEQRWFSRTVKPRPHTRPAMLAELPKFAGLFRG